MTIYIVNAIISAIIASGMYTYCDDNGMEFEWSKKRKKYCMILLFVLWVGIYACKGITGTDSYVYRSGYKSIVRSGVSLKELLASNGDRLLYEVFIYCISKLSNGNWVVLCFVAAVVIYVPILKLIYKKSENIQLSVLVYLLTLDAYSGFNGLRQVLAAGIAAYAFYCCLKEKEYVKYIILMIIAYGFHASILLLVPFHIIALRGLKSTFTRIFIFALIGSYFVLEQAWGLFSRVFGNNVVVAKYADVVSDAYHGSGVLRLLVSLAPVVLALVKYSSIKAYYEDIDSDIIMTIFSTIFMLYSMVNTDFSQMTIYFSLSNLILLPKIINCLSSSERRLMQPLVIILYFIYMILILNRGSMGINPYIPVWQSGTY